MKLDSTIPSSAFQTFILGYVDTGKVILELGSGHGSAVLANNGYTIHSVEHSKDWMDKYDNVNYIYAPIKRHKQVEGLNGVEWYDIDYLEGNIPDHDVVIVDGPPGNYGRAGLYKYFHLFNPHAIFIFDDVQRQAERGLIHKVARKKLHRPYMVEAGHKTDFGVILPPNYTWEPTCI
jgi:hypothetical protein